LFFGLEIHLVLYIAISWFFAAWMSFLLVDFEKIKRPKSWLGKLVFILSGPIGWAILIFWAMWKIAMVVLYIVRIIMFLQEKLDDEYRGDDGY